MHAQATYERLRLAVAQLESPQTVIAAAEAKGMVVPDKVTYLTPSMADVLAVALAEGRSPAPAGRRHDRRHQFRLGGGEADRRRHAVTDHDSTRRRPPARAGRRAAPPRARRCGQAGRARPPRSLALFVGCTLLLIAVVVRVGMLQTVDQQRLAAEGESQRLSNVTLTAPRGAIFDRNGFELATVHPADHAVGRSPRRGRQGRRTAAALANALGLNAEQTDDMQQRLESDKEFVYVARQVDDATAKKVADLKLKGVYQYNEPKRFYPAGDLAKGVLGGTDTDGKGTAGLEEQHERHAHRRARRADPGAGPARP